MMDVGDAADQGIFHRNDDQVGVAGFGGFDGFLKGRLGNGLGVRYRFARRQIGISARLALKGDTLGLLNSLHHNKIFRAFSRSAGVSTERGASSTRATAMLIPASSALSCSSFSRCSRAEGGSATKLSSASRR